MKYQTGDIILVRNKLIWSEFILYFMRTFQKDPVEYSHILIAVDGDKALNSNIHGLHFVNLKDYLNKCNRYKIIRYKEIAAGEMVEIYRVANILKGIGYSKKRIFLQILDHIFCTNKFTSMLQDPKDQVCSSSMAWIYWECLRFKFNNVDWYSCEPDDVDDETILNPDKWEVIETKE